MKDMLLVLIGLIPSILASSGVYIFMRRKNRADAQKSELDNVDKAVSIWRNLATDLEKKIEELEEKIRVIEEAQVKKCESCKYRKAYNEQKNAHL